MENHFNVFLCVQCEVGVGVEMVTLKAVELRKNCGLYYFSSYLTYAEK